MSKVKLYCFESPEELMKDFDEAWKSEYGNRSAAIRDLMRRFIQKKEAPR